MMRLVLSAILLLAGGCMTRFFPGAARDLPLTGKEVSVRVSACQTPASLFDCKHAPAVGVYLADYLKLNGLRPAAAAGADALTATADVAEDRGVVQITLRLASKAGSIWRAEAQGDTMLRALVRLEELLEEAVGFKERLVTHADIPKRLRLLGRSELSAEKTGFTYR